MPLECRTVHDVVRLNVPVDNVKGMHFVEDGLDGVGAGERYFRVLAEFHGELDAVGSYDEVEPHHLFYLGPHFQH